MKDISDSKQIEELSTLIEEEMKEFHAEWILHIRKNSRRLCAYNMGILVSKLATINSFVCLREKRRILKKCKKKEWKPKNG